MDAERAAERRREFALYLAGLGLALTLSAVPFICVGFHLVDRPMALGIVAALAIVQVVVHFRCFLHIDLSRSKRDDLQLILFSTLIVIFMAGGTIWIIGNEYGRMT